jgi:hypothetical protein
MNTPLPAVCQEENEKITFLPKKGNLYPILRLIKPGR